jgi:RNase P/RNase MRP subunit POP5
LLIRLLDNFLKVTRSVIFKKLSEFYGAVSTTKLGDFIYLFKRGLAIVSKQRDYFYGFGFLWIWMALDAAQIHKS